jgi:hypothetical protein
MTKTCSILPRSEEKKLYACGHEGPALWDFNLFGNKHKVIDEKVKDSGKCGQCHLDELSPQLTQCARCGVAIGPGQGCIMYENDLCCLSLDCGPGPIYAMPGIWDGQQFVDRITAGTVRLMPL